MFLGGAGAVGRWGVRFVHRMGFRGRLIVADIDFDRARGISEEVSCEAVQVDATDGVALRSLLRDADVVLSTLGPFSKFSTPILEAAIESRCDYVDVDDDWESTIEALKFDERARAAGVRVVKGLGGSPGISNLIARVACERLDETTSVLTGWAIRGGVVDPEPEYPAESSAAAYEHWLIQCSGMIRLWRDSREAEVRPLQPVEIEYPGIGRVRTYTVGHPEAITLPRWRPEIANSMNLMSGAEFVFDHLREVAQMYEAGRISLAEGAALLESPPRPSGRPPRDPVPVVWAMAHGVRDEQPATVTVHPTSLPEGKMGGSTGAPLAVGLELVLRGSVRPGVHTPEQAVAPAEFFEALLPLVDGRIGSVDELLQIRGPVQASPPLGP